MSKANGETANGRIPVHHGSLSGHEYSCWIFDCCVVQIIYFSGGQRAPVVYAAHAVKLKFHGTVFRVASS